MKIYRITYTFDNGPKNITSVYARDSKHAREKLYQSFMFPYLVKIYRVRGQ